MLVRILKIFFILLFLFATAVQYNDPDAWLWMAIYLFPVIITLIAFWRIPVQLPAIVGGLTGLIYAIWIFPGLPPDFINHEEFREAGGLMIVTLWLFYMATVDHSQQTDSDASQ